MPKDNTISQLQKKQLLKRQLERIPFFISLLAIFLVIYDIGFDQSPKQQSIFHLFYLIVLSILAVFLGGRYIFRDRPVGSKVLLFDLLFFLFVSFLLAYNFKLIELPFLQHREWIYLFFFYIFVREFSTLKIDLGLNPAQLFITGFLTIIFIGTLLLMLPNSTHAGISFIDALFTSTSAVCVTGLIVVDTGSYFTEIGQIFLVILIQLGGIGIMTFTSYFSYFFKGRFSYESQLVLRDVTHSEKIGEVISTLKKIISFTFIIEGIGAVFIYTSLDTSVIHSITEKIFFSIFHSVSGFCNAGFSTLADSLYEPGFRFNYPLHLVIAFLFILGGIGFPIVFNFFVYLKHFLMNRLIRKKSIYNPWVININTRIVVITTVILLVLGTLGFYIIEYDNTLSEHNGFGKVVTAFFGAATPRTAGFNTVDTSALNITTLLFVIFLMWIGASPSSTGGGIKTSSFAIGILNFYSIAKGKDRIEVFRREISEMSVRRAFSIILLSLIVIGFSVLLVAYFEHDKDLMPLAFESFSAFSTVGLSMGITGDLSNASKLVLIITMFVGRVSMLTILVAFLRRIRHLQYRYPTEAIYIN